MNDINVIWATQSSPFTQSRRRRWRSPQQVTIARISFGKSSILRFRNGASTKKKTQTAHISPMITFVMSAQRRGVSTGRLTHRGQQAATVKLTERGAEQVVVHKSGGRRLEDDVHPERMHQIPRVRQPRERRPEGPGEEARDRAALATERCVDQPSQAGAPDRRSGNTVEGVPGCRPRAPRQARAALL